MNEPQPSPTDAGPVVLSGSAPTPGLTETDNAGPPLPVEDGEKKRADQQRAFLLGQLLEATPSHRLQQGEANRKIRDKVRRELGLDLATANRIRAELATRGFIHT